MSIGNEHSMPKSTEDVQCFKVTELERAALTGMNKTTKQTESGFISPKILSCAWDTLELGSNLFIKGCA